MERINGQHVLEELSADLALLFAVGLCASVPQLAGVACGSFFLWIISRNMPPEW